MRALARHALTLAAVLIASIGAPFQVMAAPEGATPAADDASYLSRFEGQWTGSGLGRRGPSASTEPIRCDVSGRTQDAVLLIRGQCAGSDFSIHVLASLQYDSQSGRYLGSWRDGTGTNANLSGSRRGQTLALLLTSPAGGARPTEAGQMTLTSHGRRFRLVLQRQDGQGQPPVNITFRRR